ncbi:MAG: YbaK/EbsC family protein [Beijerinckiaceae bacterium]|nr:YbaK/EbsC family protein [Beijerinckiaceae bacterium]
MDKAPLSDSNRRVEDTARASGLTIEIEISATATRTAEEAAAVRGCSVAQIVKSLIFRGKESGEAVLLLVSGANRVDEALVAHAVGEALMRPDAQFVREVTGYAIGGIPPFGHRNRIKAFIDIDLLRFDLVYAAAGTPNSTFAIPPDDLRRASEATPIAMN